jgi:hypothetical protein
MFLANKLNKGGSLTSVDPQFNYVTMLLHGDGTNGAQNNTFLDSSANNFTITRNGNTTQGSFSPYGSNWSNFFDGSGDYLATSSTQIIPATTTYTVEAWVYLTGDYSDYREIVTQGSSGNANRWLMFVNITDGILSFQTGSTGISTSFTVPRNTWTHLAFVNNSGSYTVYANGTSVGSGSNSVTPQNTYVTVGAFQSGAEYFQGYISNVRITNTAVYTSSFTPSTTPLTAISGTRLLTCQSNRFIDNSTNSYAITAYGNSSVQRFNPFGASTAYSTSVIGGSGYFDGSGDSLTAPDDTAFDLGSGDFTIEGWVYQTATNTTGAGFVAQWTNSAALSWYLGTTTTNQFVFAWTTNGSTIQTIINSSPVTLNTWTHYAASRSGTTGRIFINGVQAATGTISGTIFNSSNVVTIGNNPNPSGSAWHLSGYMTDARVVKGTAVYTANFTPPTAPLTAVSGTSLLLKYINGAIFDNAMMNDLETVGNAQISTSVKKYGTGSLAFDGTGDYLVAPQSVITDLGAGDFTLEFWVYFNSIGSEITFAAKTESGANYGWFIQLVSGNFRVNIGNNGSLGTSRTFAWSPSTGQWYHAAVSRSSGSLRAFINGTQIGSTVTETNNGTSTALTGIGINLDGVYQALNGYIDDLRITKGYARYTANFTPPTAAFFNTGPV